MVTGRRTAAASISERSWRPLRIVLLLALAMIGMLAVGSARAGADVYVLQDGTPLVSEPGVGGKILLWVDTGFPLTVVGREGEWLKVSSSRLKSGRDIPWVPAARVGSHLPGTVDIAYSQEWPSTVPEGEDLFLEVVGTQEIRVHVRCRIVQPGKDDFIDVIDETALQLDVSGPAADCTVRNLGTSGTIDAVLRTAAGQLIARASTYTRHGAVRVRTNGPWGSAAGFVLPTRFVVLKNMTKFPFPTGNPVPPLGNPMPALGNPVPPFQQSPVPPFQQSPVPAQ
jgi:hypothetical protein